MQLLIMHFLKKWVARIPFLNSLATKAYLWLSRRRFRGSERYWIERYASRGNAGPGSFHQLARFKADFLNAFVEERAVSFVIEHGCGDGNQLSLASYPRYLGLDVSRHALERCQERFRDDPSKRFQRVDEYRGEVGDLALSLDVIFHLVEDPTFEAYMERLFASSTRYVIIYSSNREEQDPVQPPHVRHRRFSTWIEQNAPGWSLVEHHPNPHPYRGDVSRGSFADFFVYQKT
jgi:hypothetical protein